MLKQISFDEFFLEFITHDIPSLERAEHQWIGKLLWLVQKWTTKEHVFQCEMARVKKGGEYPPHTHIFEKDKIVILYNFYIGEKNETVSV